MMFKIIVLLLFISLSASTQQIKTDVWQNLTTSGKLPTQIKIQHSNNNLDLAKFGDKYYLAFRTAPTHFASKKTVLYIVSSTDLDTWNYEGEVDFNCDIREPRFAVYRDTLNLYFFRGGTKTFRFEPKEVFVCRKSLISSWTKPESIHLDGYVPWRLRELNDTLYLSAYYGKNLYKNNHQSDLRLFKSVNGVQFHKLSEQPQVNVLSAEEGEFIIDSSGTLFATVRLEGTGSLVCKADKNNLTKWEQKRSKTKYDSALFFSHKNEIYLVSRRNIDGEIDKVKHRKSEGQGRTRNLIRYSITKKVTAFFKLNKDSLTLLHLTDFTSNGDNAYAAITQIDEKTYLLMNYSSNIKHTKSSWLAGQLGRTYIYWTKLRFDE